MAPGLKTLEDATEIRRRILLAFEIAERQARLEHKLAPLNFVIVGGGPTGVELAGAVAEIAHRVVAGNFRSIDPSRARVILLEGGPRVLPSYSEDLSRSAERQLRKLGVEVMDNCVVTGVEPHRIHFGDGSLEASVILWAAGVAASPLGKMLDAPLDRAGRVLVNRTSRYPGIPRSSSSAIWLRSSRRTGNRCRASLRRRSRWESSRRKTILAEAALEETAGGPREAGGGRGGARRSFHYFDKGSLATIGRNAGIAQIGRLHLSGLIAWLAWLLVHVYFLIGFRNRVQVIWEWTWAYFRYQKGARLITGNSESITPGEAHDAMSGAAKLETPSSPPSIPERKVS